MAVTQVVGMGEVFLGFIGYISSWDGRGCFGVDAAVTFVYVCVWGGCYISGGIGELHHIALRSYLPASQD